MQMEKFGKKTLIHFTTDQFLENFTEFAIPENDIIMMKNNFQLILRHIIPYFLQWEMRDTF